MKRVVLSGFIVAVLSGCFSAQRVTLREVPDKAAPMNERVKAFKDLAPESGVQTTYLRNGVAVGTTINNIMLGDGTRVEDPRDLLPAVEVNSPAARYSNDYGEKIESARTLSTVGLVGVCVGLAAMLIPLAIPHDPGDFTPLMAGLGIGGGITLLSLIPTYMGMFKANDAATDRLSAFQAYPKALQKRLALDDESLELRRTQPPPSDAKAFSGDVPLASAQLPRLR